MRLISCIALLMVIPAVGLLTKANKFTDEKRSETPVHEHIVKDSASFSLFKGVGKSAKFDQKPIVFTTNNQLRFFCLYISTQPPYLQLIK